MASALSWCAYPRHNAFHTKQLIFPAAAFENLLLGRARQSNLARMYLARVHVRLKESVLDPQGQAVTEALHSMGHSEVGAVRIGRLIEVQLQARDEAAATTLVNEYCATLLANAVIETYSFELAALEAAP